jgi:hypothetical protein
MYRIQGTVVALTRGWRYDRLALIIPALAREAGEHEIIESQTHAQAIAVRQCDSSLIDRAKCATIIGSNTVHVVC